ncbi:MAG: septation regulator SpoVG [Thermaerobacter sp.]|nr:septation protein spoVG [Bacillota bacterium]REJ37847.1 MAG: septation protein spoVG [Bacillota bacterium]
MQITDVRLRRITGDERVRAVASITIDDAFAVHDLRVVQGDKGLFVAMPSRRRASGEYYDVAHPVTAEARQLIQQAVLAAYTREAREVAVSSG